MAVVGPSSSLWNSGKWAAKCSSGRRCSDGDVNERRRVLCEDVGAACAEQKWLPRTRTPDLSSAPPLRRPMKSPPLPAVVAPNC
ncbi:hypothetical protein SUGI_1086860 [Cryptomeria japonica]|nr:hypothetical protein SUGI_1086860 [Cryptomeria japonica]